GRLRDPGTFRGTPADLGRGSGAGHAPPLGGLGAPRATAARAGLHDHRDPAAVPLHAVLLAAVLEPGAARLAPVRRAEQLRQRLHGLHLPRGGAQHRDHHGRDGPHRDGDRRGPGAAPGSQVPRARHRPHAAHHALPRHARRGGAALEDDDVRPRLRDHQLRPVAVRRRRDRLDLPLPPARGDHRARLAVDAVHDAARPRGPAEPAARDDRGGPGRRRLLRSPVPRAHAAAPAPLHRAGHRARRDLRRQHVRRDLHDDPGRTRDSEHEPAVLPVPARLPGLRHRAGGRARRGRRGRDDHRLDDRSPAHLHELHRHRGRCL
ncbi:MAG: Various polyols ABC transporter, permease protein 1, partial [uncultured Phycisphaerae bacterium]